MCKIPRTLQIAALWVTLIIWISAAYGTPYFKPDIPDFYQHQKSGNAAWSPPNPPPNPLKPGYNNPDWWEDEWGWCYVTAWTNSFYYWDKHGYPGLFDHSNLGEEHKNKTWLERMSYAIEDLAIDLFWNNKDIPSFVAKYGYTQNQLPYTEYIWQDNKVKKITASGNIETQWGTMFDLFYDELLRSQDVIIRMEGTGSWWWSDSFHAVTGAGVERDEAQRKIWFADPDNTLHGSGWGHPYQTTDTLPLGETYYQTATFGADGCTFNSGPYSGAFVSMIYTVCPEPATLLLLSLGGLMLFRRRRQGS